MTELNENPRKKKVLPSPGTSVYALIDEDEEKKKKTLKKWRLLNKILIVPLYRARLLPLLGFGKIFLMIETKGRITGKKRRTPVEYHRVEDVITIISARGLDAGWLKNIQTNPSDVYIRKGFRGFKPRVEIINSENKKLDFLYWYVKNCGKSAKMLFGWDPKNDTIESTDFSRMVKAMTIVQAHEN
jgi:deazaflavin-dependent oxidoreductase (nitroreductase family)